MFKDAKRKDHHKDKMKFFPNSGVQKDKLETVPSDEEIAHYNELLFKCTDKINNAVNPITFFDMDVHHKGYSISTIMTLPLQIQGMDNFNIFRNNNLHQALTNMDLIGLDRHSRNIQADNLFGIILECMCTNFEIFAQNAPSLGVLDINGTGDFRRKISEQFGLYVYNNINECTDALRSHLTYTARSDLFTVSAVDPNTHEMDDNHVERLISMMNAISKQVNEMVTYIICYFVDMYLHNTITSMDDNDIGLAIERSTHIFDIIKPIKNRIEFRSFISEAIRTDIATIVTANIMPSIEHICDNSFITTYYLFTDLYNERLENEK